MPSLQHRGRWLKWTHVRVEPSSRVAPKEDARTRATGAKRALRRAVAGWEAKFAYEWLLAIGRGWPDPA